MTSKRSFDTSSVGKGLQGKHFGVVQRVGIKIWVKTHKLGCMMAHQQVILGNTSKDHFEAYQKACTEAGVTMNECAFPKWYNKEVKVKGVQQTLNFPLATKRENVTRDGLINKIVKFIVCDDQSYLVSEKSCFRELITYLSDSICEDDIPRHSTIICQINTHATEAKIGGGVPVHYLQVTPVATRCKPHHPGKTPISNKKCILVLPEYMWVTQGNLLLLELKPALQ